MAMTMTEKQKHQEQPRLDYRRTHNCGVLRKENIGDQVTLSGWVGRRRDHGGLIFIDLRDKFGLTQLVFNPELNPEVHAAAEALRSEGVITIRGEVISRSEGMANPNLPTGKIEVTVTEMEILSKAKTPPFSIADDHIEVNEDIRLKYRYLDMRRGDIVKRLTARHKAMVQTRHVLDKHGFIEIQTPILGKSTPETGARDYLVPSRIYPGSFYALPQSPQMYKQILMMGGLDRYFQFAPCFRDEDLRADRQPEFTQVDLEMSFVTKEELFALMEELMVALFQEHCEVTVPTPFRRLSHAECIDRFGTDRPDMRYGMELKSLTDIANRSDFTVFKEQIASGGIVKGICVKGGSEISRREIDEYTTFVGRFGIKGLAWMKRQDEGLSSNIVKFFSEELQNELIETLEVGVGDLIFFIADQPNKTHQGLDHLRRKIARDRGLMHPNQYEFVWVTDFPLFSWNEEEGIIESEHHPFTSPNTEDLHLLEDDPLKVRSSAYDIVLNGSEIGGGSQRIHDSDLQDRLFKALNLSDEEVKAKFGFFIEALSYGTPPPLGNCPWVRPPHDAPHPNGKHSRCHRLPKNAKGCRPHVHKPLSGHRKPAQRTQSLCKRLLGCIKNAWRLEGDRLPWLLFKPRLEEASCSCKKVYV